MCLEKHLMDLVWCFYSTWYEHIKPKKKLIIKTKIFSGTVFISNEEKGQRNSIEWSNAWSCFQDKIKLFIRRKLKQLQRNFSDIIYFAKTKRSNRFDKRNIVNYYTRLPTIYFSPREIFWKVNSKKKYIYISNWDAFVFFSSRHNYLKNSISVLYYE